MKKAIAVWVALLGVAAAAFLWRGRGDPLFAVPDELTLFALQPSGERYQDSSAPPTKFSERLGGHGVLGKATIADPSERRQLMAALADAAVNHDGKALDCFVPRHALRAIRLGRITEYLICFQCQQMTTSGEHGPFRIVSRSAEPVFDASLKKHGLPKAP